MFLFLLLVLDALLSFLCYDLLLLCVCFGGEWCFVVLIVLCLLLCVCVLLMLSFLLMLIFVVDALILLSMLCCVLLLCGGAVVFDSDLFAAGVLLMLL